MQSSSRFRVQVELQLASNARQTSVSQLHFCSLISDVQETQDANIDPR